MKCWNTLGDNDESTSHLYGPVGDCDNGSDGDGDGESDGYMWFLIGLWATICTIGGLRKRKELEATDCISTDREDLGLLGEAVWCLG